MIDLQEQQRRAAREAAAAAGQARDETVPGGRYVLDDGETMVDANGKRLSEGAPAAATPTGGGISPSDGGGSPPSDSLAALGLPASVEATLRENGFASAEALRGASDEDLDALPGIGSATVEQIRAALQGQA